MVIFAVTENGNKRTILRRSKMKQVTDFYDDNNIYNTISLSLKERLKLLFKGTLETHIDQNVQSSTGRVISHYQPKIYKERF